ncbi:DNRLRE domain-containing protein [Streptomyces sp. NBC_00335]|uniref:CBM96 family carbohydrate-binding protein n=1 Tax=unclassified Streptomyces TaxID=2593676 RepID=UPI00224DF6BC|nr:MULTISPECIES: LamG-like jellyroll fold domain-containing protein [unclassified Streptomyces]MCX5404510.1 DNRLRE domain-containing protein [Streptomyces sp. NBC_00086]
MRRSRGLTAALALSLAGAGTAIGLVLIPEASAITQPVAFTADDLPTWQPNGIVWAMAEANGTVFAGGTFSAVRPPAGAAGTEQEAVNFVALDAATGAPTSCKLSFTVGEGSATVRALTVSKDKKTLYAGGYFGAVNGTPVSSVAAIDIATCAPKASFDPKFPATVRALAVSDDTLYAAGDFSTVEDAPRERFAAVDATSGAVKPFVANADEPGRALQLSNDGKNILLGGDFFTVNGSQSHALAVVNATTGAVAKTYGTIPSMSVIKSIAADATGYYTGAEGTGGFDGRVALAPDFSEKWRDQCLGATQWVLPYDGVLYSSSHAHNCTSEGQFPDGKRHFLLAQLTDWGNGGLDAPAAVNGFVRSPAKLGWHPTANDGLGEGIGPRVMAVAEKNTTKYMWVGGEFTLINGKAQQALTRFASTGDVGAPTTPVASVSSVKPGEVQVRWRASYDADDNKLTYRIYRNGSATPIATVSANSLEWLRQQASWTDATVKAGASYSYRVTATDAAGNTSALSATVSVAVPTSVTAYPHQVREDGANLYWRYDDVVSPYVADSSVSGNTSGIQLNAPALRQTPGALTGASTAMGFNGTSQQVYSDHRQTVGSSYTLETWFKTNTTRGGKLIGFGNNQDRNSNNYDKNIYMTNTGRIFFGVNPGSAKTVSTGLFDTFNDNKWHHVVATQGPAGMALYVDGQSKGTLNVTGSQQIEGYWHVGGDNLAGWASRPTSNFFAGQIDETAVYPKVLTEAQVKNHYNLAKAATDTVSKVTATEDTYINQGAPSTAYGASTSLAVRGTAAYETYLRFDIPAAPAGTVLKSASLQIKTTTSTSAGTIDTVSVVPVTGTWSGAGTTFNTKPTLGTTPLGSFAGVPEGTAVQSVPLNTTALSAVLGSSYSLGLTSTGGDALWLWSSESTAVDAKPQLTLTFGAK